VNWNPAITVVQCSFVMFCGFVDDNNGYVMLSGYRLTGGTMTEQAAMFN
jgi:ABC-type lipopolysaccharide export system ATPase subunit